MFEMMFVIAIIVENFFPIALAFFLIRKMKSSWVVVAVGAMAFVISQIIHIPILQGLAPAWSSEQFLAMPQMMQNLIYAVTLGFLAGICEEPMRWLSFQILHEKGKKVQTGILLGVGHGGIESILIVGFSSLANFIILLSLKNGWLAEYPGVTPDMITQFFGAAWHLPLASALERLSAMGVHIGFSLMVWQSVKHRSWLWFLGAVLLHALFDALAVMLVSLGLGIWAIEIIIFIMAAVVVFWTVKTAKHEWELQLANEPTKAEIAAV